MVAHVIAPTGSLTMATAARPFRAIEKLPRGTDILIDLSGVERADSSALALVIAAVQNGRKAGQTIRLSALPDHIKPFTEIYGLAEAFDRLAQSGA